MCGAADGEHRVGRFGRGERRGEHDGGRRRPARPAELVHGADGDDRRLSLTAASRQRLATEAVPVALDDGHQAVDGVGDVGDVVPPPGTVDGQSDRHVEARERYRLARSASPGSVRSRTHRARQSVRRTRSERTWRAEICRVYGIRTIRHGPTDIARRSDPHGTPGHRSTGVPEPRAGRAGVAELGGSVGARAETASRCRVRRAVGTRGLYAGVSLRVGMRRLQRHQGAVAVALSMPRPGHELISGTTGRRCVRPPRRATRRPSRRRRRPAESDGGRRSPQRGIRAGSRRPEAANDQHRPPHPPHRVGDLLAGVEVAAPPRAGTRPRAAGRGSLRTSATADPTPMRRRSIGWPARRAPTTRRSSRSSAVAPADLDGAGRAVRPTSRSRRAGGPRRASRGGGGAPRPPARTGTRHPASSSRQTRSTSSPNRSVSSNPPIDGSRRPRTRSPRPARS